MFTFNDYFIRKKISLIYPSLRKHTQVVHFMFKARFSLESQCPLDGTQVFLSFLFFFFNTFGKRKWGATLKQWIGAVITGLMILQEITLKGKTCKLQRCSSVCFKNNWFHYFIFTLLFLIPLSNPECNLICRDSDFFQITQCCRYKIFQTDFNWHRWKCQEW